MTRLHARTFCSTFSTNGTNTVTEKEAHLLKPFDLVVILLLAVGSVMSLSEYSIFTLHGLFVKHHTYTYTLFSFSCKYYKQVCDHIHGNLVVEVTSANSSFLGQRNLTLYIEKLFIEKQ
jgi:hypothetical protein